MTARDIIGDDLQVRADTDPDYGRVIRLIVHDDAAPKGEIVLERDTALLLVMAILNALDT